MKKLEIKDHQKYKSVSHSKLLDNGEKILYKVTGMSLMENKSFSDLYIYDFKSKISRRLTTDKDTGSYIRYNDTKIIVLRKNGDSTSVNKIDLITGEESEFFKLDHKVSKLVKIDEYNYAFTTKHNTLFDREEFFTNTYEDGTPKSKLIDDYYFFDDTRYRSNDDGIINGIRARLYVYNTQSMETTLISEPSLNVSTFDVKDYEVVYAVDDTSNPMTLTMSINSYDIKTKKTELLLNSGTYDVKEIYCLDSGIILNGFDTRATNTREKPQIYSLIGSEVKNIDTQTMDINKSGGTDVKLAASEKILKDKDKLYLTLCDDGIERLASIDIDGHIEYLSIGFDYIGGFDIADGKIILEIMTDVTLTELYLYKDGNIEKLTSHNDEIMGSITISPTEVFTYHSNGDDIKGYIVRPVNMEKNKKYPGILFMHGGPRGLYTKIYQHKMQVLANEGYFCFYTNPHGSASRGKEFSSIFGKHGEMDYEDLMTFTDEVLKRYPQLDESKLGVTGHSYGGIMTNVIIGKTDRFAAAVPSASLSNYVTKAFLTDNGLGAGMLIYGDPMEDYEWTWNHSPLKNSHKVTTPTLFLHGEADYRCAYVESLQMYMALKRYGVDTQMYLFKGEPHGIKKPRNKVKWLEAMVMWFDKYLKV